MLEDLLYVDALRGGDATGLCVVTNNQGAEVIKEATHSVCFNYDKNYDEVMKIAYSKGRALLGHNRKKTSGGSDDAHAHPFVIDNKYVFFHNGTIYNHKQLGDTEVDSEALGQVLCRCDGDAKKIEEALGKVNGAYACVWWDKELNKLFFIRNKDRPLYLAEFEGGGFIYSSEAWMAMGISARRNKKIKKSENLEENVLYSIELKDWGMDIVKEKLEVKKYTAPTKTPTGTEHGKSGTKPLSKNAFKRLNRILGAGNYVSFWADDYVPKFVNMAMNLRQDWHVWGENDEYSNIQFHAIVNDMTMEEVDVDVLGNLVHGKVKDFYYSDGSAVCWIESPRVTKGTYLGRHKNETKNTHH